MIYEVCEGIDSVSDKGFFILLSLLIVRICFMLDLIVIRKGFKVNYIFVLNSKLMEVGYMMKCYLIVI